MTNPVPSYLEIIPLVSQEQLQLFLRLDKKAEAGVPKYVFIEDVGCV